MGCVASKLGEEEVVLICRERKKLLKIVLERRYALGEAHCRYSQALYAVAASIKLFVARHSSPCSPYLITLPDPEESSSKTQHSTTTMLLQQNPTHSKTHHQDQVSSSTCHCCNSKANNGDCDVDDCSSSTSSSSSSAEEQVEVEERQLGGGVTSPYFNNYMQMPMPPERDFGWDFFYPFERAENVFYVNSYDDDLRLVREKEGIPELEEEEEVVEEKKVVLTQPNNNLEQVEEEEEEEKKEQKGGVAVELGRELMEALEDIQDHFVRAYHSGKDLSRMLEANTFHFHSSSGIREIKENSTKLIQAITWHRSTSSSCKSLVASSSTWTEFKNDLFDDYGGMDAGSHSLTLGRLYAWEKKLYEEVKAGDSLRKIYERKCSRLKSQDVRGDDELTRHKTRATIKDLYARILVAIRSAESISTRIQKLRDEELQPQIVELLKGLRDVWKVMMETHETQNKILREVKTFSCPSFGKFCNDSHRLATLQVEAELHNLRECFLEFVAAQKAYVQALHIWLTKFLVPEVEFYSKGKSSGAAPYLAGGPPLLITCHDWLATMKKLPDKQVSFALKSFSKDVQALWAQQGEEQQQKRKVDGLVKEINKRTLAFQKTETKFLIEYKSEVDVENRNEEKKDTLDALKRKLEVEQEKHCKCVQETKWITLNGFQTGFSPVLESLAEFSKASLEMYNDLVSNAEKTPSFLEAGEDSQR